MSNKPRPKPFPKLPAESAAQRAALATVGTADVAAAQQWIEAFTKPGETLTSDGQTVRCSAARLRALLKAEDAS